MLKLWKEEMQKKWYQQGDSLLQEIREMLPEQEELLFWYLGQCGFVFKKEKIVYIDAVLNDITDEQGNSLRYYPIPFAPEKVKADYVLCTHAHDDHLAVETVMGIARSDSNTRFIVPGEGVEILKRAGMEDERIIEAFAGKTITLPGLTVFPIAAAHPEYRKTARGGETALCYEMTMGNFRLLHMGDTYLTSQLLSDLQERESPDLFFSPVNGMDYFRTARNCIGNLNTIETAQLAVMLKADMTIPNHYDMIKGNTVDPLDFVRQLRALDSAAKWHLPALGECVTYRKH